MVFSSFGLPLISLQRPSHVVHSLEFLAEHQGEKNDKNTCTEATHSHMSRGYQSYFASIIVTRD